MRQLLLRLRGLRADIRVALDALGAAIQIRIINTTERAVQYRQGLLHRLQQQRAAALAASGQEHVQVAIRPVAGSPTGHPDNAEEGYGEEHSGPRRQNRVRDQIRTRHRVSAGLARMRTIRSLVRDENGVGAVEFAFVAPMFLLLLLVIAELGLTLATQSVLDGATRDAARLIRTGQIQSQSSPISSFQTLLCSEMSSLMTVSSCDSNVLFEVQSYSGFGSIAFSSCTMNNNASGTGTKCTFAATTAGQIVGVRTTYTRSFIVPWVGACLSGGKCWTGPGSTGGSGSGTGGITLTSTVIFQNEPFT